jgi:N-acetylneuraminate synthase
MKIGNRIIGRERPPFVIAEMSGNHNRSLDRALAIVDAAAASGAHALKIQTYTADTMTLDVRAPGFVIEDPQSLWSGRSLYDLYQEAHTPWEWHGPIFDRARSLGMIPLSTPFDDTAVDFLETLGSEVYKVASFENTDLPLIRKIAIKGKPIIISAGMATLAELDEALRTAREAGCPDVVLLKCTSTYPATPEDTNLATLPYLRDLLGCEVGLSDHTAGIGVAVASVSLGATVIEKHFTLRRSDGGVDSAFSLEPEELTALVRESERAWQAIGTVRSGPTQTERASLQFRRSIYVTRDMEAGETLSTANIRVIRPGFGLPPRFLDVVIGMQVTRPLRRGSPLTWDSLRQPR